VATMQESAQRHAARQASWVYHMGGCAVGRLGGDGGFHQVLPPKEGCHPQGLPPLPCLQNSQISGLRGCFTEKVPIVANVPDYRKKYAILLILAICSGENGQALHLCQQGRDSYLKA